MSDIAPPGGHQRKAPSVPGMRPTRGELAWRGMVKLAWFSVATLVILAFAVVVLEVVGALWVVVLPVLLGLLLATVLSPPAALLRRVLPDALAALVVILGALGLLVGLGFALAPSVAGQSEDVADAVVAGLTDIQEWLKGPPFNLGEERIGELIDQGIQQLQSNAETIADGVLVGVNAVSGIVLNLLLALVLCFFYLKDGPKFVPWISRLSGPVAAPHLAAVSLRIWNALGGFIRAQALVGLVDAAFIGVGLLIIGVPLALPLSVLIFFGAFIPIIGAFVTGAVAALVALVTQGVTAAIIVVILIVIVQQIEGNVLQPILVGRSLDLHAGLVILAVTGGGSLFGIIGAFLAVPVVATATTLVRYLRLQLDEHARDPEDAPQAAPDAHEAKDDERAETIAEEATTDEVTASDGVAAKGESGSSPGAS
ncbi:AI-2E family transporter [Nocardioides massiliensis]|uniref:PurR-regulated permease PerM n=1 Tax=Nocardioides massiliensis TaxID=1325935 RepID=A0ABT9NPW3_9ACTN|nr:AI-2E family transporter [Nocardioides massiliensis]MDP9822469.1 putative PurR-regulated permease PerM [Nocardioides massiliensis]